MLKRFRTRIVLVLLFGFMSLGMTEAQIQALFPQGAVVVTPGGAMGCLKGACVALKETFDPSTLSVTTEVYVGGAEFAPDGSMKSFSIHHDSRLDVYNESKVMIGGELVSRGDDLIGQPPGMGEGGGPTKYVLNDSGNAVGVGDELVPDQQGIPDDTTTGGGTDGTGTDAAGGAGAGLQFLGRMAFGILSSQFSYTSGKNAHLELLENLIKVEGALQEMNIQSTQMTKFAGHLVGQGIQVPPEITQAANNYDPSKESRIVEISSLSVVKVHIEYPESRIEDIQQKMNNQDFEGLKKDVDLLADQGTYEVIVGSSLGDKLNSGVIKNSAMGLEPGVYDQYQFKTNPKSVYGKMVRRAANKAQIAQAHALSQGQNLLTDSALYNQSVAMLNIADQRFATDGILNKYIAQAEGMVRTAEEVFDVVGPNVGKGFQESLIGYADAVYAIPEMGEALYEGAKYAANNPALAAENLWEVLGETPEFVEQVYTDAKTLVENFHTLPLEQQSELVGNLMAEGAVTLASGGVGKALKVARVATVSKTVSTASAIGKTKFATKLRGTLENISKSNDMVRAVKNAPPGKPAFYVKPTGEAIPSTAYRYMPSDAEYLDDLVSTGKIPEGNYYSFDKYDDMAVASDKLQVPHDARIRAEVDMIDYLEETTVPNGDWGKGNWLEPITKDHPDFGAGGATQVVVGKPVQADKIVDLKSGETLFIRSK